jgi:protein O-GlcNAc transferase
VPRAREIIANDRHDVLLYVDIGMESVSYGLGNARLAPAQCVIWGHPVTTGIPTVDYFISNDFSEPENADAHSSERPVCLRGVQTCYRRPAVPARDGLSRPADIPESATIYLCCQSLFKIHPEMDRWLFEILRRDPNGALILFEGTHRVITERLRERLSATFGVAMDRVHILPRVKFELFPGRGVMAHYRHLGFDDCVAGSPEEYANIAVRLGTDAAFRARIEALIRERGGVLFDDRRVVEDLARCLTEAAG